MTAHQTNDRDRVVISKYLLEALTKEEQLVTALRAQIAIAERPGLERALSDHLLVTQDQIAALRFRLRELAVATESSFPGLAAAEAVVGLVGTVANKGLALAKGPLQALRGTSLADNELRNLRDCYWNEAEEIAHYRVIETVAEQVGDHDTAELARKHRAEEEAMQRALEGLLPAVVRELIETESPDPVRDRRPEPTRPTVVPSNGGAGPTKSAAATKTRATATTSTKRRGSHAGSGTTGRAKPTPSSTPASLRAKSTARRSTATAAKAARKPAPATNRPA